MPSKRPKELRQILTVSLKLYLTWIGFFSRKALLFNSFEWGPSAGPLLTFTIVETIKAKQGGCLVRAKVVLGHVCTELLLIGLLLLGLAPLLEDSQVIKAFGIEGAFMILLALLSLRDAFAKKIDLKTHSDWRSNQTQAKENPLAGPSLKQHGLRERCGWFYPLICGALVSIRNPFWWIWWATGGGIFMSQLDN